MLMKFSNDIEKQRLQIAIVERLRIINFIQNLIKK